ncbi:MAG: glycosyltransferase family 2 protein [Candidatus Peribacteraceae bacterium]|nr:glycosyltransferase family 2 protein [Candidatus Peribacteraceae bacterium]
MDRKDVAVVVPVFNRANTVLRTLESILQQTRQPDTLVIVDDGSSDGSADAVEQWLRARRPSCAWRVVRCERNRGAGAARNKAMTLLNTFAYITFLDSDDLWPTDFLERTLQAIAGDATAVAASCDRQRIRANGRMRKRNSAVHLARNAPQWLMRHGGGILSCTVFRTAMIGDIRFDETNLLGTEDLTFLLPLSLRGPWLAAPGAPMVMDRRIAEANREEINLSRVHKNTFHNWVAVIEDFLANVRGWEQHVSPAKADRICALLWTCAGFQYARHGEFRQSLACMGTAIARFSGSLVGGRFR